MVIEISDKTWSMVQWEIHHRRYLVQEIIQILEYFEGMQSLEEDVIDQVKEAIERFDKKMLQAWKMEPEDITVELAAIKFEEAKIIK